MKRLLFFLTITLIGCSAPTSEDEKTDLAPSLDAPYAHFYNFPETIYQNIKPGLQFDHLFQALLQEEWQLKNQNETCHFFNVKDSTALIFPNYEHQPITEILSFKIILRSSLYLNEPERFQNFLTAKSSSIKQNDDLAIIEFDQPELVISYFVQQTFIRLVINP
jgi:hypothetical protein